MKSKVTIVTGEQGSGKTTLARKLAAEAGVFVEVSASDVLGTFGLSACASAPKTVLIEEAEACRRAQLLSLIKGWISSPEVTVRRKHQPPVNIPTPNFIVVCTSGFENSLVDQRRFRVVNASREARA